MLGTTGKLFQLESLLRQLPEGAVPDGTGTGTGTGEGEGAAEADAASLSASLVSVLSVPSEAHSASARRRTSSSGRRHRRRKSRAGSPTSRSRKSSVSEGRRRARRRDRQREAALKPSKSRQMQKQQERSQGQGQGQGQEQQGQLALGLGLQPNPVPLSKSRSDQTRGTLLTASTTGSTTAYTEDQRSRSRADTGSLTLTGSLSLDPPSTAGTGGDGTADGTAADGIAAEGGFAPPASSSSAAAAGGGGGGGDSFPPGTAALGFAGDDQASLAPPALAPGDAASLNYPDDEDRGDAVIKRIKSLSFRPPLYRDIVDAPFDEADEDKDDDDESCLTNGSSSVEVPIVHPMARRPSDGELIFPADAAMGVSGGEHEPLPRSISVQNTPLFFPNDTDDENTVGASTLNTVGASTLGASTLGASTLGASTHGTLSTVGPPTISTTGDGTAGTGTNNAASSSLPPGGRPPPAPPLGLIPPGLPSPQAFRRVLSFGTQSIRSIKSLGSASSAFASRSWANLPACTDGLQRVGQADEDAASILSGAGDAAGGEADLGADDRSAGAGAVAGAGAGALDQDEQPPALPRVPSGSPGASPPETPLKLARPDALSPAGTAATVTSPMSPDPASPDQAGEGGEGVRGGGAEVEVGAEEAAEGSNGIFRPLKNDGDGRDAEGAASGVPSIDHSMSSGSHSIPGILSPAYKFTPIDSLGDSTDNDGSTVDNYDFDEEIDSLDDGNEDHRFAKALHDGIVEEFAADVAVEGAGEGGAGKAASIDMMLRYVKRTVKRLERVEEEEPQTAADWNAFAMADLEKREGKHAIKQGGEDFSIYDLPLLVSRTICDSYNSFATAETIDGSPDQGDEKPCTSTAPTRAVDAVPVQDDGRIGNTREESAPDNDGDKI